MLGAGKAAAEMAAVTERTYLEQGLDPKSGRLSGSVATRHGYGVETKIISVDEAGHPIPDDASINAAQTALKLATTATPNDLILVLLSGGASAIWCAPVPGISLDEKQDLTRKLLRAGASIHEINAVRKHLSAIKGGGLAEAAWSAQTNRQTGTRLITLAISDVPGDHPSTIGSGPTSGDETTLMDARTVVEKYNIQVSENIRNILSDPANETPEPNNEIFENTSFKIIASAKLALDAAARCAKKLGYKPLIIGEAFEGEASQVGHNHAILALEKMAGRSPVALISGGELTVKVTGSGSGGPNQEYILAMLTKLNGSSGISAIAADSDGSDGGTGSKDDPAGAFITPDTLNMAKSLNLNPAIFLENNDSSGFFRKLNRLIVTGPTQTNVNDIRIILIDPKSVS